MAPRIEVEKSGNNVVLRAPEHPLLAERATALGGRSKGRDWTFPAAKESAVKALARDLWGVEGRGGQTVTVRVDLSLYGESAMGRVGEAWLAGRLLARRRTFDSPVELGDGVKLVSGSFSAWGGSPAHPALGARYGTVVDVAGVPQGAAEQAEREFPFEVKVVRDGEAQVGAWSRTVTERIPGPGARAEANLSGREGKGRDASKGAKAGAASSAAPAKKAAPAPAPAAKKAAPAPAAKKAAPTPAAKKAAPAPSPRKAEPSPKKAAPKASKKSTKKTKAKAAPKPAPARAAKKSTKRTKATAPKAAPARAAAKKASKKKATKRTAPARPAARAAKKTAKRSPARKAAPARKSAPARRTAPARKASKKKASRGGRR